MVEKYSDEEFESLLTKYDYSFKRGDIVKGVVCAYESDGAIIDIGSKSTAFVPSYEVSSDRKAKAEDVLEKGVEYEFLILNDCDENGKFNLSYKKVHLAHTWSELAKVKEADETIAATVVNTVKGGLIVDVSGVQGFIPQGQLCAREAICNVGDKIEVKILTLDKAQNNLILSNRKVYETNMAETRKSVFAQIEVGQIVKGEVVRITDFGAFVNIGGVDCLLPLSQISWKWVEHPTDLLKVGQEINVEIIDIDHDKQRISLSLKNTEPDPWIKAEEELKEGEIKEGVVTRIKAFGAFVEVLPGVEALLPQSALAELQNTKNIIVKTGDKIDTKIIKFNPKDKRISLGLPTDEV
ncbi:MAG: 30S ribosomal protein S1 [Cyanobacteria bacterium SIG28]|nr:30S ribosomal protein S1 [Cyanobacteria bacterium SIG28]